MKRLVACLLALVSGISGGALPVSGQLSAKDIWAEFTPALSSYSGTMTIGSGSGAGYVSGSFGSLSPTVIQSTRTITGMYQTAGQTFLQISGFTVSPGVLWFGTLNTTHVSTVWTFPSSTAGYSFSAGVATWIWPYTNSGGISGWALYPGNSMSVTISGGSVSPTTNIRLSDYYRGGTLVPNIACNAGVPTSGPIKFSDFYGACRQ